MNTPDTMAVLEAFIRVIPKQMAVGNIEKLGDLGTFRASLVCEPTQEESKFDATHIKNVKRPLDAVGISAVLTRPVEKFQRSQR